MHAKPPRGKTRRPIKIPNAERLKNIALYYLSRYAASEASLRRVLDNRVRRAKMAHPDFAKDEAAHAAIRIAIDQIVEAHKKTGAVNDAAIAAMKVSSLRRSGRSERFIRQKLAGKGLDKNLVGDALAEYDGEEGGGEADQKAALAFARKRRLGSFRPAAKAKDGDKKRDFAALARAGFSSSIIRTVLQDIPEEGTED